MIFAVGTFPLLHFRADEFESGKSATQVRLAAFRLHGERVIVRTARNTVFVNGIIGVFEMRTFIEGYISFRKMSVETESIAIMNFCLFRPQT